MSFVTSELTDDYIFLTLLGRTEIKDPIDGDIAINSGAPYAKYSSESWRRFLINQG